MTDRTDRIVAVLFCGTADEYGRWGSRVMRKAAMRGDSLANPAHRAKIQRELKRARRRDRTERLLDGRPLEVGPA